MVVANGQVEVEGNDQKRVTGGRETARWCCFKRSLNSDQTRRTRGWGTGFSGVQFWLPVPVPQGNPWHLPAGFSYPWQSLGQAEPSHHQHWQWHCYPTCKGTTVSPTSSHMFPSTLIFFYICISMYNTTTPPIVVLVPISICSISLCGIPDWSYRFGSDRYLYVYSLRAENFWVPTPHSIIDLAPGHLSPLHYLRVSLPVLWSSLLYLKSSLPYLSRLSLPLLRSSLPCLRSSSTPFHALKHLADELMPWSHLELS